VVFLLLFGRLGLLRLLLSGSLSQNRSHPSARGLVGLLLLHEGHAAGDDVLRHGHVQSVATESVPVASQQFFCHFVGRCVDVTVGPES